MTPIILVKSQSVDAHRALALNLQPLPLMPKAQKDFWPYDKLPEPYVAIENGDLGTALSAFATREMLDYRLHGSSHSDVWVCGFGVTLWLMGDTDGAGRVWSRACDDALKGRFKYSSSGTYQSGLLLWFASVWLKNASWHDEAERLFEKLLRQKRPTTSGHFSSLLARLLRREIDLAQVRDSYKEERALTRDNYEWSALFYAGVRAYEDGNIKETRRLWSQAKERTESSVALPFYLLHAERKKMD